MTHPLSTLAAEIREACETLKGMINFGDFDACEVYVEADMIALAEKLDTWAAALGVPK